MSDRHELGNMIFNLENKKNLKEVNFTKDAVREVLGYLKELYEIENQKHEEDRRIADLEAKLAESETLIQRLQSVIDNLRNKSFAGSTLVDAITNVYEPIYKVKFDECEELKQQLAEKERQIKGLGLYTKNVIEFAVEQLERVKEILLENLYDLYSKPSEIWDKYGDLYDVVVEGAVNGTIDNQIKQLKGNTDGTTN